jgi:hypothetical protein
MKNLMDGFIMFNIFFHKDEQNGGIQVKMLIKKKKKMKMKKK